LFYTSRGKKAADYMQGEQKKRQEPKTTRDKKKQKKKYVGTMLSLCPKGETQTGIPTIGGGGGQHLVVEAEKMGGRGITSCVNVLTLQGKGGDRVNEA